MLSNLKKSLIERYYFRILLELSCYFFYSYRCLAITTVRFHFIWWQHFSHSKEKCHGSRAHHNAKSKDYPHITLILRQPKMRQDFEWNTHIHCKEMPSRLVDPGGPLLIILFCGSEVCWFDPSRGWWIFSELKVLSMTSIGREVKPGSNLGRPACSPAHFCLSHLAHHLVFTIILILYVWKFHNVLVTYAL